MCPNRSRETENGKGQGSGQAMMLMFILTIVVVVALVGSLPTWPHSKNWGYYPIGGVSVVILVILILLFAGHMRAH
jgi:hypothetical protein